MKQATISVSVGIVAHNEAKNIAAVIADISSQMQSGWSLTTIYVACGGCTDDTVAIVKSLHNKYVVLIENPKREGKAADEQKIFDRCTDDILVLFDADVRLKDTRVIDRLITTFTDNPDISLVGGNARPNTPKTFFEKAVYTTFMTLDESRHTIHGGNNVYGASGQCLALRKSLYQQIRFPKGIIAEDDFIYFTNLKNHGGFRYCKEAIVHYHLPKNLPDYFRQTLRSDTSSSIAHTYSYFGDMVTAEYHRPLPFYASIVWKSFLWNPLGTLYMMCVRVASRVVIPFTTKHYSLNWYTAGSTK
jgi:glycosyltransferase involved in cell wall biosynthesis